MNLLEGYAKFTSVVEASLSPLDATANVKDEQ